MSAADRHKHILFPLGHHHIIILIQAPPAPSIVLHKAQTALEERCVRRGHFLVGVRSERDRDTSGTLGNLGLRSAGIVLLFSPCCFYTGLLLSDIPVYLAEQCVGDKCTPHALIKQELVAPRMVP